MTQDTPSIEMLGHLIAFDTVSSKSNLELIAFVEAYLAEFGIASRRTVSPDGEKANLYATIGPEDAGGIVLSGHTDVVPVEGQPWTSDPFHLTRRDSRLYGRGTSDMKAFIAVCLALAPEAAQVALRKPLHFALSFDEEVGCTGVGHLIEDVTRNLPMPAAVIIGEPSDMKLVNAHKGGYGFRTTVTGKEAHSSQLHRAGHAVYAAIDLIQFVRQIAEEKRRSAPPDSPFDPPYSTLSVGTIDGGTALNIVPRQCVFEWEMRPLPGDDAEEVLDRFNRFAETEVLPRLRETAPEASIATEVEAAVPALQPEPDSPAEALVRLLTGANQTHVVSYCTEGGLFQRAGLSTVICGPGSIDQAHKPDEFIEISQIEACEDFLRRLIEWAATA
ncbi:MAG: acetylornithine deacetylase [Kiloniellales bacterium]|nr:acetylornithine deacetylase [Kiloniellales bacterium]